ncbi:unnamed protein product [Malus baccata var. baccata]
METVKVTPIAELCPYTKADKIKIRVCRIWKSSISATVHKYVTLHCILVDETNDTFLCKASVKRFDTHYDWWYNACRSCVKQMHKDPSTGQLICQKHPNQIPTPW